MFQSHGDRRWFKTGGLNTYSWQMWQWSSWGLVHVKLYKRKTNERTVCLLQGLQHRLSWLVGGWTSFSFCGEGHKKSVFWPKIIIIVSLHLSYLYNGTQLWLVLCLQTETHSNMWSSLLYHLSIYNVALRFTWSSDYSEAEVSIDH